MIAYSFIPPLYHLVLRKLSDASDFVASHWGWLLGIFLLLFLLFVLIVIVKEYDEVARKEKEQNLRQERQRQEQEAQKERQRQEQEAQKKRELAVKNEAERVVEKFSKYLTPCFIIDSNIWMNEDYESFFNLLIFLCRRHAYKLKLFGPQFDEISNIKKTSKYETAKNKRARLAISRIERFQKARCLSILPITIDAKPGAYADPLIVELITNQTRNGVECTFISDDKELRILVRQYLLDNSRAKWKIVEIDSLKSDCESFWLASKLK